MLTIISSNYQYCAVPLNGQTNTLTPSQQVYTLRYTAPVLPGYMRTVNQGNIWKQSYKTIDL